MKDIIITGFNDKTADHLYGREISMHKRYNKIKLPKDFAAKLSPTDEMLNKDVLTRTMYIPPVHMRTINNTEYVLLMPWLNLINGAFDKRNLPWMQHVQSSIMSKSTISVRIIRVLKEILTALKGGYTPNNPNEAYNLTARTKKHIFNVIADSVNNSTVPSWVISMLLFYNPIVHGRIYHTIQHVYTMKDIPKIAFTMGGRKVDTMYRSIRSENNHKALFYNSLEMFLSPIMGDFHYNDNISNAGNKQFNFAPDTNYTGRFVELRASNARGPTGGRGSIRLTDEFQITPLITPVIKITDLFNIVNSMNYDPTSRKGIPVVNRDLIKFNVYDDVFDRTHSAYARTPAGLRMKAFREKHLKKLLSTGCNIDYIDRYSSETNYLGGLTNASTLRTVLKYKESVRSYTSISQVAIDSIKSISEVDVTTDEHISNVEVINWLLQFGDTHIPLFNRI